MQGCMRALERFVAAHSSDGSIGSANCRHDALDKSLHLSKQIKTQAAAVQHTRNAMLQDALHLSERHAIKSKPARIT